MSIERLAKLAFSFTSLFLLTLVSYSQTTYTAIASGNWNVKSNWSPNTASGGPSSNDSVIIPSGFSITINTNSTINNVTVNSGGFLVGQANFTVTGNFLVDGSYSNNSNTTLSGSGKTISGAGGITQSIATFDITNDHTVLSGTALTISNTTDVTISSGKTVTNNGTVTITGNVSGSGIWTNSTNSYLYIGGTLLSSGTLNASATGNTVNYYADIDQIIKIPSGNTYYNLAATGGGNKTLSGSGTLTVNNNLSISSNLNSSGIYSLNVGGSWVNTGTFDETTITTVVFNGTDASLSSVESGGETFTNLTINKSSSTNTLSLSNNVIVAGTGATALTMTQGNINTGSNKITLGTSTSSVGKLSWVSGRIIGQFEQYIPGIGSYAFPLGSTSGATPLTITFYTGHLTTGSLIAQFVASYPGSTGLPVSESGGSPTMNNTFTEGYWSISSPNTLVSDSYDIHLTGSWFSSFPSPSKTSNSRILTRTNSSGSWALDGLNASGTNYLDISRTSVTNGATSQFCFGTDYNCTPPSSSLSITSGSGSFSSCQGTSTTYGLSGSGAGSGPYSYVWSISPAGSGTITSGAGTASVTVNWTTSGTGTLSVIETNNCTNGPTITQNIRIETVPPSSITGLLYAPQNSITAVSYSIASDANYNSSYTYSWDASTGSSPGTITSSSSGVGLSSVNIKWGAAGTGKVKVTASNGTCASSSYTLSVNVYKTIKSVSAGKNWTNSIAWDCGCVPSSTDNVEIVAGFPVTLNSAQTVNNLVVDGGAILTIGANSLTVKGDLVLYGSISGTTGNIILNGLSTTSSISVTGVSDFSSTGIFTSTTGLLSFTNDYSVSSGSSFTKSGGSIQLGSGVNLTNNGTVYVSGDITGLNASTSQWTNAANSTLKITGSLLATGVLNASSSGNTINYASTALTQNIKTPLSSQYVNLYFTGAGGLSTPSSSVTLNVSGNWLNSATGSSGGYTGFNPNGGTIVFNGSTTMAGPTTAVNLITTTTVTSFNNITISGTFSSSDGIINVGNNFINNGTFSHNNGTVVFNGTTQTISGTNASLTNFNSITINNGTTFTAPSTLNVQGVLTNNGSFNTTGTVAFSSTISSTTSQIAGNNKIQFKNITVADGSNATDLILAASVGADMSGILTLSGSATFDSDGASGSNVFTLLSTGDKPTVDASVAALTGSNPAAQLPGKMTVQRYLSKIGVSIYNYQVWRDISSPVQTTVSDMANSSKASGLYLPVTTSFAGGSTVSGASGPSMYSYAENTTTDTNGDGVIDLNDGWNGFPVSSMSESFTAGQGYQAFIFGSDPPVSSTGIAKFDLTGVVNTGSVSLPVTYTVRDASHANGDYNNGWNLVGNPYPSTIYWGASGWIKTNINDAIYIDDYSTANPVFQSYVNGVGTNHWTGYIGIGQGFWVKASGSNPVLTATESVKTAGTQTTIFRQETPTDLLRVTLKTADGLSDESVVYFTDSATANFDRKYDAMKLPNQYGYLNLSTVTGDVYYAINGLSFTDCQQHQVALSVKDVVDGNYTLNFSDFGAMSPAMDIQLTDNFTNTVVNIRQQPDYVFTVVQSNASSYGTDRFSLTFTYNGGPVPLKAMGKDVCNQSQSVITVNNSSSDFYYGLSTVGGEVIAPVATMGNGGDLQLQVPAGKVASGQNIFVVSQMNRYCNSVTSTSNVTFTFAALPVAPLAKPSTACGSSSLSLTASGAPSDGSYVWYDSLDLSVPVYSGSSYTTPVLTATKSYFVTSVNTLGCAGPGVWVQAIITHTDPTLVASTKDVTNCGAGSVSLSASGASSAGTYNWYDSLTATAPSFSGQAFTTPVLSKTKTYYVAASNNTACEGTRVAVTASIVNLDAATVTVQNDLKTLQSNYTTGNQWYKDGVLIAGATGQQYIPTQMGSYTVMVTSSGCSVTSLPVAFIVEAVENSADPDVKVYPNPVKSILTIEVAGSERVEGEIYNPLGQRIGALNFVSDGSTTTANHDFTHSTPGVYLVKINKGNEVRFLRVVRE